MNEQFIPIDIHYNKLSDWLLSRRLCDHGWQTQILKIRELINNALQDMPEHPEVTKLLAGSYINYFHCKQIVEILRETEAATKNIFGRYSSQRMKDWQEIVRLYEQNSIYLAEAAQLLTRNVNYEVPSYKKQIAKAQQQQKDYVKKEEEYAHNSADLQKKFTNDCKMIGIDGKKIKTELMALVEDLPTKYEKVAKKLKSFQPLLSYYNEFLTFTLGENFNGNSLPMINFLIKHGNTTAFEWIYGRPPTSLHPPKHDYTIEDEEDEEKQGEAEEIDWGIIDMPEASASESAINLEEIDFGDDVVDIDWGDVEEEIQIVDESVLKATADNSSSVDPDAAVGLDALTLLDNPNTRSQFLNELEELLAFLTFRLQESQEDGDLLSDAMFHKAQSSIMLKPSQIQAMLDDCSAVHQELTSKHMQELMLIRNSPRFVERLASRLKKISSDAEKAMSMSRLMVVRQKEAEELEQSIYPKLSLVKEKTKELQKQIQEEISKRFKNRPVNIMGEINIM